ncbi:MAG: DUF86 domain-containing protein [Candidatus Omnitrophica bacterium]|nr:DUF86 domain-containing protein [Candidatus Omnitrophota bacterium]
MPRDVLVYLEDILTAISRIKTYTRNEKLERFRKDLKTIDATVRNLEIIGEAVKKLPVDIRMQQPSIEWQKIAGLRDILIHEYFGIDAEIIWDIIQNKLGSLETSCQKILKEKTSESKD